MQNIHTLQEVNTKYLIIVKTQELSKTEVKVLKALMKGFIAKEIASKMFLSVHTVFTHIKDIKSKLNAKSIAQAVVKYLASVDNPKHILKALLFVTIQCYVVVSASGFDYRRVPRTRIVKRHERINNWS